MYREELFTEEESELIQAWLDKFYHLLGYTLFVSAIETSSPLRAGVRAGSTLHSLLEKLIPGEYPMTGRAPLCTEESCENSIWNDVICNVDEATVAAVNKVFTMPSQDDEEEGLDDGLFKKIYGQFINSIFGDK